MYTYTVNALKRVFIAWLPLAAAVTGLSMLCYLGAQQVLRQSFNDAPVQIAEGALSEINAGTKPADVTNGHVDIAQSITPFVIVYDADGKVIGGNGQLDGQIPTPPHGVFENVDFWRYGHSWEPKNDIRIDAAIIPFTVNGVSGFVLGGRNMRLMEAHIEHLGALMLAAWAVIMFTTFVLALFARFVA